MLHRPALVLDPHVLIGNHARAVEDACVRYHTIARTAQKRKLCETMKNAIDQTSEPAQVLSGRAARTGGRPGWNLLWHRFKRHSEASPARQRPNRRKREICRIAWTRVTRPSDREHR